MILSKFSLSKFPALFILATPAKFVSSSCLEFSFAVIDEPPPVPEPPVSSSSLNVKSKFFEVLSRAILPVTLIRPAIFTFVKFALPLASSKSTNVPCVLIK